MTCLPLWTPLYYCEKELGATTHQLSIRGIFQLYYCEKELCIAIMLAQT